MKEQLEELLKEIKRKPNLTSIELSSILGTNPDMIRKRVSQLRDLGHPIHSERVGGYNYSEEGYIENLKKNIIGQITPLVQSYNKKSLAYQNKDNMTIEELDKDFEKYFGSNVKEAK